MTRRTPVLTFLFLALALLLAACASSAAAPDPARTTPQLRSLPPTPAPITSTPLPTTYDGGQNPNGTFYRGAADAPVTIVEYSDFL